jgi:alcohol dehydrogenase (cytochrome c)
MNIRLCSSVIVVALAHTTLFAQGGLDPEMLTKPAVESWPSYNGDYSARRYSPLKDVNQSTVKNLSLAWVSDLPVDTRPSTAAGAPHFSMGGEAAEAVPVGGAGGLRIVGGVLQVNGILYMSATDHAWAVDARSGTVLWHYYWKTRGGTHIGNRGMAMYHDWLYFETPDDYLVSLDARTGKERWHREISNFALQYFSTTAPLVIGNHLLVGTGDDLDEPGFLQSVDLETGELQWKLYTVPLTADDPALKTWPSLDAARHGGAQPWLTGSYDPETHLYIFGTGNPTPGFTGETRPGDNLYTSCIIAVNVDTGKMAWYYQTSPHDTHDWDATEAIVLVDGEFQGKPRKLAVQANRNGYFFVLDRVTGEHLLTTQFGATANWATAIDERGRPKGNRAKDTSIAGSLVSPNNPGITNWPAPAYSPVTGYLYVTENEPFTEFYLTDPDPRGAMGLGGKEEDTIGWTGFAIEAIDYKTGKVAWKHTFPEDPANTVFGARQPGLLATAGNLLFGADRAGNFVAFDPATGDPIWHTHIGQVSNAAETYMLDGHQYVLVAVSDSIYAFTLN